MPRLCSGANSVNCLLGLDDAVPAAPAADGEGKAAGVGKAEVRSVPESPSMETASASASASSNPLHADGRAGVEKPPAAAGEAPTAARVSSEDERRPPPHKAVSLDSTPR